MYHFYVERGRGKGVGKGMPVPATITEQKKILRSTNKAHGKLAGVNLVYTNSVNLNVNVNIHWMDRHITTIFLKFSIFTPLKRNQIQSIIPGTIRAGIMLCDNKKSCFRYTNVMITV